jgi:hypothetical protein
MNTAVALSFPHNFGQWLHRAHQRGLVTVSGDHANPVITMADADIETAYQWLSAYKTTDADKAEWIYENIIGEATDEALADLFDDLATGGEMAIKRRYVMGLVRKYHAPMLCELAFGPDRRMSKADMDNETWKRRMEA